MMMKINRESTSEFPSPALRERSGEGERVRASDDPARFARHPLSNSPPQSGGEGDWKITRNKASKKAQSLRKNQTDAETIFWHAVKAKRFCDHKFRRQHPVGRYFADFACLEGMLIVEIDGGQHCENARDEARTAFLQKEGYTVLRWNHEVLTDLDGVLQALKGHLEQSHGPQ